MHRTIPVVCLLLALSFAMAGVSGAADTRTYFQAGLDGVHKIHESFLNERTEEAPAPVPVEPRSGMETIWLRHLSDAIFTTTSLGAPAGKLAAATYLNPPKEIGVYAIEGDGTPDWTATGTELYVSTSRDGSVIASVDYNQSAQTVVVGRWELGSSTPLWTTAISPASRGSERTLLVSGDGSTIAVLVTMQDTGGARLYLFDPASSTPIGVFDGPAGFARNLSIGEDGRFAAFIGLANAYVVDRDAGIIRWSGSMGASTDPIAISTDGRYLVFGWTSMRVLEWNGSGYANLWTVMGGTHWLGICEFSADGSRLAVGWYRQTTYDQNRIQLYTMPSSTPLWVYDYPVGGGSYQDVPSDISWTPDGDWILVASFGDQLAINDELHLFRHDQPTPVATFDTPGSVFDADVAADGAGGVYIASCGKAVHANQQGRGGDLYSLRYRIPAGVPAADPPDAILRLESAPNPYRPDQPIRFALGQAGEVRAEIVDVLGRRVRILVDRAFADGEHVLRWDGRDEAARPVVSGSYYLVLSGPSERQSARLVVVH